MKAVLVVSLFLLLLAARALANEVVFPVLREVRVVPAVESEGITLKGVEARLRAEFVGRPLAMADLEAMSEAVLSFYQKAGRPVTAVDFLPGEEEGVLEVVIREGRVGRVLTELPEHVNAGVIERGFRLKPGELLRQEALDEETAWLNRHPYRKAQLLASPGEGFGEADLLFRFSNPRPWRAFANYSNSGARGLDLHRFSVGGSYWLPTDHVVQGQAIFGRSVDEFQAYSVGYEMPLHRWRQLVAVRLSWASVESETASSVSGGESFRVEGAYTIPLSTSGGFEQALSFGFDSLQTDSFLFFLGTAFPSEELQIVQGYLRYEASRKTESDRLDLKLGAYLHPGEWLGLTDESAFASYDPEAERNAFYVNGEASYLRQLPEDLSLLVRMRGQVSPHRLFPSQRMAFGATEGLRSFEPRSFLADSGWNGSVEVRSPAWEWSEAQVQAGVFSDWGYLSFQKETAVEEDGEWQAAVGANLAMEWDGGFSLSISQGFSLEERGAFTSVSATWRF
ncbi:MAG: ShlB/FhaC/HecB family hemolysin secretion/activation protein [Verrucomicrobiota bacterium]